MNDGTPVAQGHTLPELLAMLGIAAVLAAAAIPVFSNLVLESRMNAAVATAMHAINLARQFSATRSEAVQLCGSDDSRHCSKRMDWTGGLLLTGEPDRFAQQLDLPQGGSPRLRSNRSTLEFEAGTGFATPATLTLCDRRGTRAARAVIVSRSGRPRTSLRDGSDLALTC